MLVLLSIAETIGALSDRVFFRQDFMITTEELTILDNSSSLYVINAVLVTL